MSQYGEHETILRLLGDVDEARRAFIDVGAFDGKTFSNTWELAERGWKGILVEPNPIAFSSLMRNYAGREAHLVMGAIERKKGVRTLWVNTADGETTDMLSSIDPAHVKKCSASGYPFSGVLVHTVTWEDLLPLPWIRQAAYLNIDVEGINYDVLETMPREIQPTVVCIEKDPAERVSAMVEEFQRRGYNYFEDVGGNLIAARRH